MPGDSEADKTEDIAAGLGEAVQHARTLQNNLGDDAAPSTLVEALAPEDQDTRLAEPIPPEEMADRLGTLANASLAPSLTASVGAVAEEFREMQQMQVGAIAAELKEIQRMQVGTIAAEIQEVHQQLLGGVARNMSEMSSFQLGGVLDELNNKSFAATAMKSPELSYPRGTVDPSLVPSSPAPKPESEPKTLELSESEFYEIGEEAGVIICCDECGSCFLRQNSHRMLTTSEGRVVCGQCRDAGRSVQ